MSDVAIDHSREDARRRFRLLEMAGGDLEKAKTLEAWVHTGSETAVIYKATRVTSPVAEAALAESEERRNGPTGMVNDVDRILAESRRNILDDMPSIPDFLKRSPTP